MIPSLLTLCHIEGGPSGDPEEGSGGGGIVAEVNLGAAALGPSLVVAV